MKILRISIGFALALSVALGPASARTGNGTVWCSYYKPSYDGRTTAGGEKFDSNALTAAHRKYKMGTKLKLTNVANNKSVVVTVNDRGPFVKNRSISVTKKAAEELDFVQQGKARVRVEKQ